VREVVEKRWRDKMAAVKMKCRKEMKMNECTVNERRR